MVDPAALDIAELDHTATAAIDTLEVARVRAARRELEARLLALVGQHGWSRRVSWRAGHSVGGDEQVWRRFARYGLPDDQQAVLTHLQALPRSAAGRTDP